MKLVPRWKVGTHLACVSSSSPAWCCPFPSVAVSHPPIPPPSGTLRLVPARIAAILFGFALGVRIHLLRHERWTAWASRWPTRWSSESARRWLSGALIPRRRLHPPSAPFPPVRRRGHLPGRRGHLRRSAGRMRRSFGLPLALRRVLGRLQLLLPSSPASCRPSSTSATALAPTGGRSRDRLGVLPLHRHQFHLASDAAGRLGPEYSFFAATWWPTQLERRFVFAKVPFTGRMDSAS